MNARCLILALASLALAVPAPAATATPKPGPLHVPSPDWRDQVIYFVMTDRFDDGDPSNNDQGTGEYAAADPARYNGGDLRGVQRRLDYIQGLGATTVWITPPVLQRWWDPRANHGGYHGYWAEDFSRMDPHVGTLADYRALARALHGRGMYLVQDIVLNHTGDWLDYAGGWNPDDPAAHVELQPDAHGRTAPSQWPFSMNDPRDSKQRAAGIYHWTPKVADFRDPRQVLDFQMSGLDDLASENPLVRRTLRRNYGDWIRKAGVDGFRVDTIFYVPTEAVDDFLHADDPRAPGVERVAAATGRKDFLSFGEGFAIDKPGEDTQARRIEAYATAPDGHAITPGMINFPLYGALGDVFARGRPTAELGARIDSMMKVHARPHRMPSFVDNHDVDRFLAGGDTVGLQQALLAILTLPGIPTLYYGTEQGFTVPRAAMFAAGSDSGGRDRFDTSAPLYRFLQQAIALRRGDTVFSRGSPTVLQGNPAGAGGIAWRMDEGDRHALVAMNTADHPVLLDNLDTGLAAGTRLRGAFALAGQAEDLVAGVGGGVHLVLPARSARVWIAQPGPGAIPAPASRPGIASFPAGVLRDDIVVGGLGPANTVLRLVVDGDLAGAAEVSTDAAGRWSATLDTSAMVDPRITHRLVAWDVAAAQASAPRSFRVERAWRELARLEDPAGDDRGPTGSYLYPGDASWAGRTLDILGVTVDGSGGALRLSLRMGAISRSWNPPNGFDHVALFVYLQLPGEDGGATLMPFQNASLPAGMRWHRRLRVHGWSNALFTDEGAGTGVEGRAITPAAGIEADPDTATIRLTLSPAALGRRRDLSGARLYVSTWDYDGGMRALEPAASMSRFGGGDGARDPRVMDDTAVIVLP